MVDCDEWKGPLRDWRFLLHKEEYPPAIDEYQKIQMEEDDVTVFYGASDDLLEAEGAFNEEFGAWKGTTIYFEHGYVTAEWTGGNPTWVISTNVPHVTFDIMEEGEVFCKGIIVHQSDLGEMIDEERD